MEHKPSHRIATAKQAGVVDFAKMLSPERVVDLGQVAKREAIETLIARTVETSKRVGDSEAFSRAVWEREALSSTDVGHGIGVPHVRIASVSDFVMAVGRSREGVDYGARDGNPVHLVVLLAANDSQSNAFLKVLARLMSKLRHADYCQKLLAAKDPVTVYKLLSEA